MNTITWEVTLHDVSAQALCNWAENGWIIPYSRKNVVPLPKNARIDDIVESGMQLSLSGLHEKHQNLPDEVLWNRKIAWQQQDQNPAHLRATLERKNDYRTETHLWFVMGSFARRVADLVPIKFHAGEVRLCIYTLSTQNDGIHKLFTESFLWWYFRGQKAQACPTLMLIQHQS